MAAESAGREPVTMILCRGYTQKKMLRVGAPIETEAADVREGGRVALGMDVRWPPR